VFLVSLEGVSQNIQEQQKEIDQLDSRVTGTEDDVKQLTAEVEDNKQEIADVKDDVKKQGEQLEELAEVVEETVEKVEELDHKVSSPTYEELFLLPPRADCLLWRHATAPNMRRNTTVKIETTYNQNTKKYQHQTTPYMMWQWHTHRLKENKRFSVLMVDYGTVRKRHDDR